MVSVRSSTVRVVMLDPPSILMPLATAGLLPVDLPMSVTFPVPVRIVEPASKTPAASAVVLPAISTLPPAVPGAPAGSTRVSIVTPFSVMPASPALWELAKPTPLSTRPPPIFTLPPSVLMLVPLATLTLPPAVLFVSDVTSRLSLPVGVAADAGVSDVMSALMLMAPVALRRRATSPPDVFRMASVMVMELSFGPVRLSVWMFTEVPLFSVSVTFATSAIELPCRGSPARRVLTSMSPGSISHSPALPRSEEARTSPVIQTFAPEVSTIPPAPAPLPRAVISPAKRVSPSDQTATVPPAPPSAVASARRAAPCSILTFWACASVPEPCQPPPISIVPPCMPLASVKLPVPRFTSRAVMRIAPGASAREEARTTPS